MLRYHNLYYDAAGQWSARTFPIPPTPDMPWYPRVLDPTMFVAVVYDDRGEIPTIDAAREALAQTTCKIEGIPDGARGCLAWVTMQIPGLPKHRRNCVEIQVWVEVVQ